MQELIRKITFKLNRLFNIRMASDPYISGDTFRKLADIKIDDENGLHELRRVHSGAIVFCATHVLDSFVKKALPIIQNKFTLITHNSDYKIDQKYLPLLNHELLTHWFAQNNMVRHTKITSIPIGLENRFFHNHGRPSSFNTRARFRALNNVKVLCAFSIHTNPREREAALEVLRSHSLVDVVNIKASSYLDSLSDYAFVVSPEGNGVDCHRTWEALYLGVIPIVRGSEFYSQFPEFPGLVLNQWEDLLKYDSDSLAEIHAACRQKLVKANFIWMPYWQKMISMISDNSKE